MENIHQLDEKGQSSPRARVVGLRAELEPVAPGLVTAITSRNQPLFAKDLETHWEQISEIIRSSRVLVVGGAGSIGASFVQLLIDLAPRSLAVVDIDENGLADLVRNLRASSAPVPKDFCTAVVSLGSVAFERFFLASGYWDLIFNFAAMKHVRSERDPYSLMRMIETNVFGLEQLCRLAETHGTKALFSVSSDKAVLPASLMGATKRWMELILSLPRQRLVCSSARFANVAFSKGSLLHAFLDRLGRRQPIAAPSDIRRYFLSHQEAAQLCLLAGTLAKARQIFVPKLDSEKYAISMEDVARRVLTYHGLEIVLCSDPEAALNHPALREAERRGWPCWLSSSDTSGEKSLEDLWTPEEIRDDASFGAVSVILPPDSSPDLLDEARRRVATTAQKNQWHKEELVAAIKLVVPELTHHEAHRSLDEKL